MKLKKCNRILLQFEIQLKVENTIDLPQLNLYQPSMEPINNQEEVSPKPPWRFSVIINLQGKKILHQILKRKLNEIWKSSEPFPLIDLSED